MAVLGFVFVTLSLGKDCLNQSLRGSPCFQVVRVADLRFLGASWLALLAASGLLWIAEVIEEHTKLAKKIGRRSIYVCPPSLLLSCRLR